MDSKKLINFSVVSKVLTESRGTIRLNRKNANYAGPLKELFDFLEEWTTKNSKSKETIITVKTVSK